MLASSKLVLQTLLSFRSLFSKFARVKTAPDRSASDSLARARLDARKSNFRGRCIIANDSEQVHTDKMKAKLDQFGIADPNPDTNNLPDSLGIFTGADYGWYFAEKYGLLTAWGGKSELNALYVGAYIEELDMLDIIECPKVIVETDNGIGEGECGLAHTDELALINSLNSLVEGSKNHFRSYVEQIELIIGYGNYKAQVLTQEEVDIILGR